MANNKHRILIALPVTMITAFGFISDTLAGVKKVNNSNITMKSGNRAGLQYLYAWDKNCRPISVRFKAMKVSKGRLYTVPGMFKIARSQSAKCAGKSIPGKKVVFKANRNATGKTVVQYRIASKNIADDFIISRPITVRK